MRERKCYRENIELIGSFFPKRAALTMPEVCKLVGLDRRTLLADRTFPARMVGNKYMIPVTALAAWM